MKRFAFALTAVLIFLGMFEIALRVIDYKGAPPLSEQLQDMRFKVIGTLHGEFDERRFWKLPNVEPRFSGDNPKVICLADSVTVMYEGKGYPDLLPEAFEKAGYEKPVEVFNGGVPEYTSYQGLTYLNRELIKENPNLVTLQFGLNDHWESRLGTPDQDVKFPNQDELDRLKLMMGSRTYQFLRTTILSMRFTPRVPLDQYEKNMENMVNSVKLQGGHTIIIMPMFLNRQQNWISLHEKYEQATSRAAMKTGAALIDLRDRFKNDPNLFIDPENDWVHFNWKGAAIIADEIVKTALKQKWMP